MKNHQVDQKTDEWFHLRKGKITGTDLKAIMGTPKAKQDAIYEIVSQRLTVGVENDDNYENPMARGNRLEPFAIAAFEFETGKKVNRIGLSESDENPRIANSPDGLIGKHEAIEVKCMGGKNHVKTWLTNEIPDDYRWQVVQYFVVNEGLKKLYFVAYNPDIPSHPLHVIGATREELADDIAKAKTAQDNFLFEVEEILKKIIEL